MNAFETCFIYDFAVKLFKFTHYLFLLSHNIHEELIHALPLQYYFPPKKEFKTLIQLQIILQHGCDRIIIQKVNEKCEQTSEKERLRTV